tara:strand:+ start:451 stop:672 length:222 start_codon:yes stop_codon:yes gene_type:complete
MGSIFSKPKMPSAPRRVTQNQDSESARLKQEKIDKQRQLQARMRARRKGGLRMLLSQDRENAGLGLGESDTLG